MADQHPAGGGDADDQNTSQIQGNLTVHGTLKVSSPHQHAAHGGDAEGNRGGRSGTFDRVLRIIEIIVGAIVGIALVVVGALQWGVYSQQAAIMQADQRPYLWLSTDLGQPIRGAEGKVVWYLHFQNYGKAPALDLRQSTSIKTDGDEFKKSFGLKERKDIGIPIPPGSVATVPATSEPNIPEDQIQRGLLIDKFFGVSATITYTDRYNGKYITTICLERGATGVIAYCETGNDIK